MRRTGVLFCLLVLGCTRPGAYLAPRAPVVAIDEAHHNVHTLGGTYRPLADALRATGFAVEPHTELFQTSALAPYDVLIISNARAAGREAPLEERGRPAFSRAEIEAVFDWVWKGGSLLLVLDHYPIPGANADLLARLDVDAVNGITEDSLLFDETVGAIVFDRTLDAIGDHPITCGLGREQRVDRVATFSGTSLRGGANATPVLVFSPGAIDQLRPSRDARSAAGRSQAIAMRIGRGRVAVLGEAAALRIFDTPSAQNQQFAINTVAWLARKLDDGNALGCTG